MKKFEPIQLDILNSTNKNQLVSAGAGSGKTTVMIEKIANLILDGVSIDNLLVVTFTVLASHEMKQRLIEKLNDVYQKENRIDILEIIEKIETANIDTIDGFASKTIKKYFYELSISPNIEIISDATKDYYINRAMKKTIQDYSKDINKINILLDLFGGNSRNFDSLENLILNNYYNIINIENYQDFLEQSKQEYVDSCKSENVLNQYILKNVSKLKSVIIDNYSFVSENENIKILLDDLDLFNINLSFKSNLKSLQNFNFIDFKKKEIEQNPNLEEIKQTVKELKSVKENFEKLGINLDFDEKNLKIYEFFMLFIEILENFIENYNNIKNKYNLIDFNDLNRLMLKLLNNESIKKDLQTKFKYIFVDEYQDVNPLQDKLISNLVGENTTLFTVGDVKQSIYGFRGASPEWFLKKYKSFKNLNSGDVFDMNINFRSSPKIMNFVNDIFSTMMTESSSDIDYKKDCIIDAKRTDIKDEKVKIVLVKDNEEKEIAKGLYSVKDDNNEETNNSKKLEAFIVLKQITELIGTEFYDANLKENRKLQYSDFAILTHSEKDENSKVLINLLRENNIPLNINNKLDVKKSECIKLILSILKCVINAGDDVDYLASFIALTSVDINDIIEIRTNQNLLDDLKSNIENEKIKTGFDILAKIKYSSYTKSNTELIRYILNDLGVKYYLIAKENGEKELNLLEEFLNKLSPLEDCLNLCEFIEMVESNVNKSSDFASSDQEDSVTLQTIHKSKGLEYPVVILYNSSKKFSHLMDNDTINFNADIGLGMDYYDILNRTKTSSVVKYAIQLKNQEKGYKEELRLLYVALTRAKNKLIITGTYNQKSIDEKSIKKTNFTNVLLTPYVDFIKDNFYENNNVKINFIDEVEEINIVSDKSCPNYEIYGLDFNYPNQQKFKVPLKNTVTGLNSKKSQEIKFSTKDWLSRTMQYNAEENSAEIGTHYHKALEILDFSKPYEKNTNFEDVDYNLIEKAYNKIQPLLTDSISIKKEANFMMYVPYNQLVESDVDDKVLVQGVVDLLIEKENSFIIVDYKFSKLNSKILKEKYLEQLNLYKMAVEKAYNKKVEHVYIYSILNNELI